MAVSGVRYRGKKKVLDKVKEFDAFPKVPDEYVDSTTVGGSFSVLTFLLALWLIYSEVTYYLDSNLVFKFVPDTKLNERLRMNIDITVAMPCSNIGADILDSTQQSVFGFGELQEEDTWFELTQEQQDSFEAVKYLNSYLRKEYHSIWQLLWKKGHGSVRATIPPRKTKPNRKPDACRLHGVLSLNKVAGNFHITAGKSLHLPRGHIHLNMQSGDIPLNFSHRIHRFSFGSPANGIIYPLEGDEKIIKESDTLFLYFMDIVPTHVDTTFQTTKTFQYSVRELARPIDHHKGSHGIPGIFFKYDVAALRVKVFQQRESLLQLTLRIFATIAGIYVVVGIVNTIVLATRTKSKKTSSPHKPVYDKYHKNPLLIVPDLSVPEVNQ